MKTITKMTMAAAVAASVSTAANAVPVSMYQQVTDMQIVLGSSNLLAPPGSVSYMDIGGDTVTGITLTGLTTGYVANTYVSLEWNLTDGIRQGVNGAGGTVFEGGYLYVSTSTDGGATYIPFDTVDASVTNIPFLSGQDGHYYPAPTQTTGGLVIDDSGYITTQGLWDLAFYGSGWNAAVASVTLFGQSFGVFMEVSDVPVPAAAWLFGSALLGLAGLGRKTSRVI